MNHNDNNNDNPAEEDLSPFEYDCRKIRENDPTTKAVDLSYSSVELRDDATTHLLCEALANNTNLRHLYLNVQGLSVQGAAEFVETVAKSNLVSLGFEGDVVAAEIKQALFRLLARETLKLKALSIRMPLEEEDVTLLNECLKERRLSKFTLDPRLPPSLSVDAAKDLMKIVANSREVVVTGYMDPSIQRVFFRDGIRAPEHVVRSLTFQSSRVDDLNGLVASLPYLTELRLSHCRGLTVDFDRFCTGLSRASHLSLLELSQCDLGDHEMSTLAHALSNNRSITTLDLGHNGITDVGIAALVEHWNDASPLKNLVLSGNRSISHRGVQLLLSAVAGNDNNKSLDSLTISYVLGGFGYAGLHTVAQEVLPLARVRKIDLLGCASLFFRSKRPRRSKVLARKNASQALLDAVHRNTYLRSIKFARHELTRNVDKEMKFELATRRHGRYLLSEEHGLGEAIWCPILAKCPSASVIYFLLREHPALVKRNDDGHGNSKKRRASSLEESAAKRNKE